MFCCHLGVTWTVPPIEIASRVFGVTNKVRDQTTPALLDLAKQLLVQSKGDKHLRNHVQHNPIRTRTERRITGDEFRKADVPFRRLPHV
jgi:hypothetical protein